MSWMFVIVVALLLANLAVAVRASRRAPASDVTGEEHLRQVIARRRAEERARESSS